MSAARKALEALEAALKASDRRVDLRKFPHANHDFRLEAIAVNLSAPLAAVVRAVADRPWMERDLNGVAYRCFLCGRDQEIVGVGHFDGCGAKEADAALDAFNAAALAQGFA